MTTKGDNEPIDPFGLQRCGPDTVAGRYLRRFWHPVALGSTLRVGRARPARALGEDFTLYRGAGGGVYAIDAACAHRCTMLAIGSVEGENLRCLYHGWMYDGTGQCIDQPAEPEPFAAKVRIRSLPTQEYLGLIFCYFGSDKPPALPRYPQFEETGLLRSSGYIRECNYFQNIDNHCDPVHVNFAHRLSLYPAMTQAGVSQELPLVTADETEYGIALHTTYPDGRTSTNRIIMPNGAQFALPPSLAGEEAWSDHLAWRVPIDDEHHFSCRAELRKFSGEGVELYIAEELRKRERVATTAPRVREMMAQILAGDASLADFAGVIDPDDLVYLEDSLSQEGQGRMVDRSKEHLGRTDVGVILYRKIFGREMRAMEVGQPMKQWAIPSTVATSAV